MKNPSEVLAGTLLMMAGFGMVTGGFWLVWDWADWYRYSNGGAGWNFTYPLYIRTVTAENATEPFDIGFGMGIIGGFLLTLGPFVAAWRESSREQSSCCLTRTLDTFSYRY